MFVADGQARVRGRPRLAAPAAPAGLPPPAAAAAAAARALGRGSSTCQ
jgi:hypothetical protein